MKQIKNTFTLVKMIVAAAVILIIISYLMGCGMIELQIQRLKGELIGNSYTANCYDNYGNKTFTVKGDKVSISYENDESGEKSSYIDIAIDGYSWHHVGGTLLFLQDGVDVVTEFDLDDTIQSNYQESLGFQPADRFINHYQNLIGESRVVLLSSQHGTPICLLQGNSVTMEIPSDLPKTTMLNIDGKLVYIHRGNIDIFSSSLLKN